MRKRIIGLAAAVLITGLAPVVSAQSARGGTAASGQGAAKPSTGARGGAVALPIPVDPRLGPQAFSVVLVVGEMGNATTTDSVPPAARKALTDMRDFLPYKSYRLLDTQWTLCCGREPIYSRLRGVDEQEYDFYLQASVMQTSASSVPVVNVQTFNLTEARPSTGEVDSLRKEIEALRRKQVTETSAASSTKDELRALEAQLAAASRRPSNRAVINTSFRMEVGETVVVGTSRIQGDKALIALLTAVPPKGAPR